jgi:NAD+ kinase
MMVHVALVHQPYRPETAQSAGLAGTWLESRGSTCELLSAFELDGHDASPFGLALSFGGDGTTLRTARWAVRAGLPIVPIGMGTLSFLAELAPTDLGDALAPYLAGDFWRDERAMLGVELADAGADGAPLLALNDVVVARGAAVRAISIDLAVHGHHVTRFTADGLVVATATGSTAYALAAGGPVMAPELRSIVLVPIAGHLSALGSLVLPESAEIQLTVARSRPATLSVDGQIDRDLPVNRQIHLRLAKERTVFARRGDRRDFYAHLTARLRRA